jgi:hypothetical protein
MVTVDELVIKIGANVTGALAGISAVDASMKKMDSSVVASAASIRGATTKMVKAFAAVGVAATALGAVAGVSFTKQASEMESYMITIEQLTGSHEKAAEKMKWLLDFAKSTPFELPGLIEATVKLGAYGIEAESVLKTLGDTASAMGKPINMAVEALADAQTGEFERMKEFGIKAVVVSEANAAQLGATAEEVGLTALSYVDKFGKQQASIIDRNNREQITSTVSAIWNDKYAGGMAKQAMGMSGMVSNIKDAMYQGTLAIMGFDTATGAFKPESLFIKAKDAVRGLLDSINSIDFSVIATKVQGHVDNTIAIVSNLVKKLSPTWDNLKSTFDSTAGIISDITDAFKDSEGGSIAFADAMNALTGALASVFAWIDEHPKITKLAVTLGVAAVAFSAIVSVVGTVGAAISGILGAAASLELIFLTTTTTATFLGGVLAALGGPITLIIVAVAALAGAWATNMFGIRDITNDVFGTLKGLFIDLVNFIGPKLETLINFYVDVFNAMVPILNAAGFELQTMAEMHFEAISKAAKAAAVSVEESTTQMADAMTPGGETGLQTTTPDVTPGVGAGTGVGSAGASGSLADAWLAAGNFISGSGEYVSKNKMGAFGGPDNTASSLAAGISSGMTEQATQATQLSISTILSQSLEVHKSSNAKLDMLNKLTEVSAKLDTLKIEVNNYVTNISSGGGFGKTDLKDTMSGTTSGA